ncbi:MAG: peptidase T, partial [Verrucomicrobia bacterium]|nr:peptidase T [Prolixibacteraceae bacterium]
MEKVTDRFLRYAKVYTTSDPSRTDVYPSTSRQLDFADQLTKELISIGLSEVTRDQFGYVTATL